MPGRGGPSPLVAGPQAAWRDVFSRANLPAMEWQTGAPRSLPPFPWAVAAFVAGVCVLQWQPRLPPLWFPLLLVVLAGGALRYRPRLGGLFLALVVGIAWADWRAGERLDQALPAALEGRDLTLEGTLVGLPETRPRGRRFLFQVDADGAQGFHGRVRLNWNRGAPPLVPGDRWRLRVRLKAPHGFADPGAFDYEGWLFRAGIQATGYVRHPRAARRLPGWDRTRALDRIRFRLRERLRALIGERPALGPLLALVLGDRSAIARETWETLTRTGVNHLFAISGLHVGILAALGFLLVERVWRLSPRLLRRLAAPRAGALAGMAAALGYAALAGFAISTQRALAMTTAVLLAVVLGRALRPVQVFALAAFAVVAWDPLAVTAAGFWLSFGAVAALLWALGARPGCGRGVRCLGRAQGAVALGLAPPLLGLFGRVSVVAPLVNLVAVPLFGLLLPLILGASLVALSGLWAGALDLPAWILEQGLAALEGLAAHPWAAWSPPAPPPWSLGLATLGVAVLLAPAGLPGRPLGVLLCAPLWLLRPAGPPPGAFDFTLLDVGQGLAAVVRTRGHCLVYDTGPRFPSGFNTGDAVVRPFLARLGLSRVDTLILSHADNDHAGGLAGLVGRVSLGRVLSGEPARIGRGLRVEACRPGQAWDWDGVRFEILGPPVLDRGNDSSCVLRVAGRGGAVLLTGDAGREAEAWLARRWKDRLAATLWVAGHHGSATSTGAPLLARVRPEWVWFAAGYRNHWGFPRPQVVARVHAVHARTADTVSGGALHMRFGPGDMHSPLAAWRERAARYWTHRPMKYD